MAAKVHKIHYPESVDELIGILEKGKGAAAPVGGGVSFSFSVPPKIKELASLRKLGLDTITYNKEGLHLGALVTMNQLAASPHVRNFRNGVVAKTASLVGSTPNRNLITVGGNAMRLFIWSDLPAVYCTLDAAFKVRGPEGERLVGWKEFYRKQPIMHLNRAEFLEEVIIPNAPSRSGASFEKFSETANTFALLTASASVSLDNKGKCVSARLGFGGLQLLPAVSPEVEKMLVGESPTRELIAAAAGTAVEKINMVKDFRVSAGYKRELAVAVGQQVLTHAFKRAQGENED